MAVRRRSNSRERGLSIRPIGCTPARSVTYSAAAAAVALVALYECYAFTFLPFKTHLRKQDVDSTSWFDALSPLSSGHDASELAARSAVVCHRLSAMFVQATVECEW